MNIEQLLNPLKEQWLKRSGRERKLLALILIALPIVFIYFFVLSPFNTKLVDMQQNIEKNQELYSWMGPRIERIRQLRSRTTAMPKVGNQSLLTLVDQSTHSAKLAQFVKQIGQTEGDKVLVNFTDVPFDTLADWIEALWGNYTIIVNKLTITPAETTGLVQAELIVEHKQI